MFDRRTFLIASGAALIAARASDLLERAIARAGGDRALRRARILQWSGAATVTAGGRTLEIDMVTHVEPFVRARSDSWLTSEGPTHKRSLIVEGEQGWIERNGQRKPMPAAMLAHERAQYAIYGLMRLVSLQDKDASWAPGFLPDRLIARHPLAPETILGFDTDARLAWATNRIPAVNGSAIVDQRFEFSGEMENGGVRWPQRLTIAEGGEPYFDLRLKSFAVQS